MTKSQKLHVEALEAKALLNALRGKETLTEAETAEVRQLEKRDSEIPGELRAAHEAEERAAEEARAAFEAGSAGDGESAEIRALLGTVHELGKATLSGYLVHAQVGSALDGAEAELNDALSVRATGGGIAIPWALLDEPSIRDRIERRADVATTSSALGGPERQRPILQRLFGRDILDALGVRVDTVPAGVSEWPLVTGTAAPAQRDEDAAAPDAAAATFATQTLRPKRLTGRYIFGVEAAAEVAGLEQALRRDLGDAVRAQMSDQVINGDGAAPNIAGFLARLAAPNPAPTDIAEFADYAGVHAQAVDGIHAMRESEVSSVLGVATYRHAASVYQAGSGESGAEALMRRSAGCRASSFVPAVVSNVQDGGLLHAGMDAMRGDSIAAVWPALEVIRDIYSRAGQGEVILTWITLWDAYTAFRSEAYKRISFKVSG